MAVECTYEWCIRRAVACPDPSGNQVYFMLPNLEQLTNPNQRAIFFSVVDHSY
jgi:hypothetical protein